MYKFGIDVSIIWKKICCYDMVIGFVVGKFGSNYFVFVDRDYFLFSFFVLRVF